MIKDFLEVERSKLKKKRKNEEKKLSGDGEVQVQKIRK
jgi:hypothetical protein